VADVGCNWIWLGFRSGVRDLAWVPQSSFYNIRGSIIFKLFSVVWGLLFEMRQENLQVNIPNYNFVFIGNFPLHI